MGNHEFCSKCHDDDFHYGRPCNPELLAKVQQEKDNQELRKQIGLKKLELVKRLLKQHGVEFSESTYNEGIKINWFDLA